MVLLVELKISNRDLRDIQYLLLDSQSVTAHRMTACSYSDSVVSVFRIYSFHINLVFWGRGEYDIFKLYKFVLTIELL